MIHLTQLHLKLIPTLNLMLYFIWLFVTSRSLCLRAYWEALFRPLSILRMEIQILNLKNPLKLMLKNGQGIYRQCLLICPSLKLLETFHTHRFPTLEMKVKQRKSLSLHVTKLVRLCLGYPSVFGPAGSAYHDVLESPLELPMRLLDTNVNCEKSYMDVYFAWVFSQCQFI